MSPFDKARYTRLLRGLEVSEIHIAQAYLAHHDFRLDSEFYSQDNLRKEDAVKKLPHKLVSEIASLIAGPFGSAITAEQYDPVSQYRYIRATDIQSFFINKNAPVYVQKATYNAFPQFHLQENDILLTVVGMNFGKPAIIFESDCPAIFSCKSTLIRNSRVNPWYLVTYMSCTIGHGLIRRGQRGAAQPGINLSDIDTVLVPIVSDVFQKKIEVLVKHGRSLVIESRAVYEDAEKLLLDELGLTGFIPSEECVNVRAFKDSLGLTGRLDAEYYQPKYEEYEIAVRGHYAGYTTIAAQFDLVKETSRRDKSAYNYIEIGDVNVADGAATFNRLNVEELPENAKQEVRLGDLLISKVRPNRGAVAIIDFDATDLIVSGAFTVLREKADSVFSNETLKVLLRTPMYRDWVLKFNVGTQYPVIRDEDILSLPIPFINDEVQEKIAVIVRESSSLKVESERQLDVAKRAVEIAIEQDEKSALVYLEAQA